MKRLIYLSMAISLLIGLLPAVSAAQPPSAVGPEGPDRTAHPSGKPVPAWAERSTAAAGQRLLKSGVQGAGPDVLLVHGDADGDPYSPGYPEPDWFQTYYSISPSGVVPHDGSSYMAAFNAYYTQPTSSSRLATGPLDLSGASPQVDFWMVHDTTYSGPGPEYREDYVQVQVSTDGITWTDVGEPVLRVDGSCTTPCWRQHSVVLTGYDQNGVYVAFLGVSDYGV
jgi:hypothetical protein